MRKSKLVVETSSFVSAGDLESERMGAIKLKMACSRFERKKEKGKKGCAEARGMTYDNDTVDAVNCEESPAPGEYPPRQRSGEPDFALVTLESIDVAVHLVL